MMADTGTSPPPVDGVRRVRVTQLPATTPERPVVIPVIAAPVVTSSVCSQGTDTAVVATSDSAPVEVSKSKRKQVLNEIYETEKTYHYNLMLLTTLFLEPVRVSSILPPKLIEGMLAVLLLNCSSVFIFYLKR